MPSINTVLSKLNIFTKSMENATIQGNKFNGSNQLVKLGNDGKLPAIDGSLLTGISGSTSYTSFIAQENIPAYKVVTSDGYLADSSNVSQRNKIIGIAIAAVFAGFSGNVIGSGEITNALWGWTPGDRVYLNGNVLSTTPPASGYLQYIGTAISADKIDVKLSESILL